MDNFEIHAYTREIISYSSKINKYVNDEEPWAKIKQLDNRVATVLNTSLNCLKNIFILLHPIMPSKCENFLNCIGIPKEEINLELITKKIKIGTKLTMPGLLFKKYI